MNTQRTLLTRVLQIQVLRPWCWYCERDFEDEKGTVVLQNSGSPG
jgi:hypothetical protein